MNSRGSTAGKASTSRGSSAAKSKAVPTKNTKPSTQLGTRKGRSNVSSEPPPPTIEQLSEQIKKLEEDLENEKKQRNHFQVERISKNELNNLKAELRNKDRQMEELEEKHQVEIKVYKQRVKHLHFEHQNNITHLKTEGEMELKQQNDLHRASESTMKKVAKKIKAETKELEISHEDLVKNMKQEHEKTITKLRHEFEKNAKELHQKYERKMQQLREELELRRKNEVHEIEERKNRHINDLISKHDQAFAEIKAYYNDSTANNLELIKSLKEQLEELKKKESSDQKLMLEVTMENKRLSEPLQKAQKEVEHLRHDLANYQKEKESLKMAKGRIKFLETELKSIRWEHEVLEQRFEQIQKERDDLYDRFVTSIHEVQQKSGLKNILLEKKLEALNADLEVKVNHYDLSSKQTQLSQVIASVNLDPTSVKSVTKKVEDVLEEKNKMIKELQYELNRSKKVIYKERVDKRLNRI